MHEATIAAKILEGVSARIERLDPAGRARCVRVRIGQFRNVDSHSLAFAFNSLKKSYPTCAACTLVLEAVAAVALCRSGNHRYQPSPDMAYR
ncbi:MAG TPA: hydrogenase maturation nickel metallochaperone HypA, partial [Candidatus Obscuribacterales bacterium]